ncbi:hypothetical protein [Methylorubrum extorquens]|uniref:Uncharacterized protein n=1 Tax=Methylorubrum extorquens TaxID=408 RepID=A0AAX3WP77_METEX|nr:MULTISPECIES: hypothetical protein [Methylobacteriaceae]MBA9069204.1 hypothetical protein [Methylobacterium sp. RAS18]WHQ72198.1 hypothetical protein KEC54_11935 [Methylorubrum extorquens]
MAIVTEIRSWHRAPRDRGVSDVRARLARTLATALRRMAEARYAQQVDRLARSGHGGVL